MKMSKIKNFVIVALVITAVYQTGMLWLEVSASHNIFYYVFEKLSNVGTGFNNQLSAIDPEEIVVGFGDKKFVKTIAAKSNDINKYADGIIKEIIEKAVYEGSAELSWDSYLEGKVVLYGFPFVVSMTEYSKGMGVKNLGGTYKNINFDCVAISPSKSASETTTIYFINTEMGETYKFTMANTDNGASLYSEIEALQSAQNNGIYYLSAKQSSFNIFRQYAFIPQWSGNALNYDKIDSSISYIVDNKIDQKLLENGISGYFPNAANKQTSIADGVYTFSNQDTVVKFYENGILEYYNYRSGDLNEEQTLATAYTACKNFLNNNKSIAYNIKLKNIELKNEGLVFYFDYSFNNMDIEFSDELKSSLGITNALEIVVTNNSVKKCRMVAYDFKISKEKGQVSVDFSTALSNVMSVVNLSGNITEVQNMNLAYKITGAKEDELRWYVTVDGKKYETDIKPNTVFFEEETE